MRPAPRRPGEQLDLVGDAGAGRVDQPERPAARARSAYSVSAHDLLDRARAPRAGLHRRVVGHHAHRPTVDAADAGDDAVGGQVAGERVGEQPVLDERALVEQQREPVADEQLALAARASRVPVEVALARALRRGPQLVAGTATTTRARR